MNLLFATTNKGKIQEVSEILDIPLDMVSLEIDEVQSVDIEYVARKKAEKAYELAGRPVIVDDVGVFIEAWNGFPGPFGKHIFEALGYDGLVKILANERNRNVKVIAAIGYHDGEKVHVFKGEVKGVLAEEKRGTEGWGFDPLIIPDGHDKTFAEMGQDGKNKISHRALALARLKAFLDSQNKQKAL